jgi:uncharacterized membrane protein
MSEPQCFEGLANWRLPCIEAGERSGSECGEEKRTAEILRPPKSGGLRLTGYGIRRRNAMDRMLVVVFDAESKAYEGKKALHELENEDMVVVYAQAVVARNADGTARVAQNDDPRPVGTLSGGSLGAIIGLFGGPAGVAVGTAAGVAVGATVDLDHARIGEDFVEDVRQKLLPEKFALVAEIQEDSTIPVDARMEALGGTVFRRALSEVRHTVDDKETAARKADLAQMKAEHAQAHADRKAKLQEKINQLDSKIQARLEKAKERRQAAEAQAKAKAEILQAKAAALKIKATGTHAS